VFYNKINKFLLGEVAFPDAWIRRRSSYRLLMVVPGQDDKVPTIIALLNFKERVLALFMFMN
jgi:hypothetical protein